jgi:hypothetical protein
MLFGRLLVEAAIGATHMKSEHMFDYRGRSDTTK